jgi:hypothetical protein
MLHNVIVQLAQQDDVGAGHAIDETGIGIETGQSRAGGKQPCHEDDR